MTQKSGSEKLEKAYRLKSPADNLAYYRDFAKCYDSDFAKGLGYAYPAKVAAIYLADARPDDQPVADIGCGTGLVAVGLEDVVVDGMDISPEMLAVARDRGCYRQLFEVDLTGDLGGLPSDYGAVISAGAFTHGHLGPEVLGRLLNIARPGALFVIGVNRGHFHDRGFEPVLQSLQDRGRIGAVTATEVPIYDKMGHEHSGDMALVLVWRLAR